MIVVANFFGARKHGLTEQFCIANTSPRWWKGEVIKELTPGKIVWKLKRGKITKGDYTFKYNKQLKRLDEHGFDWNHLEGKTLLCWCPSGKFCHRFLLADFLEAKGFEVERR